MKASKPTSALRVAALAALALAAVIGILSFPADESSSWLAEFLSFKAAGFAAAWKFHALYRRWAKSDPWVGAYDRWCGTPYGGAKL